MLRAKNSAGGPELRPGSCTGGRVNGRVPERGPRPINLLLPEPGMRPVPISTFTPSLAGAQ
jgi:hypothetical protein